MLRGTALLALAFAACGPSPQARDEAKVTYRARFSAEPGVATKVVFPYPLDASQTELVAGLTVTEGATVRVETALPEGPGLALEGKGEVEASFSAPRMGGLGSEPVPQAQLSRQVPDGGMSDRYIRVNKGGSGLAQIEFEYTAARDCGAGCGGQRSWTFRGPVGLGPQAVEMTFEEKQR